jgi:hypothetical protein
MGAGTPRHPLQRPLMAVCTKSTDGGVTWPAPTLEELLRPEDEEALSLADFEDEQ